LVTLPFAAISAGTPLGFYGTLGTKTMKNQFDYVRKYYGVPARRGGRVLVYGKPGRITSGAGHYIRIRLDGEKRSGYYHPTDHVEYLD
jgi:hypothetical protein